MHIVTPNTTAAVTAAPDPPTHPVPGRAWNHEMIHGQIRVYADTLADLIAALTDPAYTTLDEVAAYVARLRLAYTAEATHQATLLAQHAETVSELTDTERAILCTPRHEAPVVDRWDSQVPLVLTRDRYEPYGDAPRPLHDPGLIIWLDATSNTALLQSLHQVGIVTVADRADHTSVAS